MRFFKKHIQYLGHLVSKEGFEPLPEKLEAIKKMLVPKNLKEVKQFLGLIGYYCKFVPHFADISWPLKRLTQRNTKFEWTKQCKKSFNHLREMLMQYPILRYPNLNKEYFLYTDASRIGWSGVLTQEYSDEKGKLKFHPICYVSRQFRGSQINLAALTKEAYAIYMVVRQLSFYITDANVFVRSDYLPLKKFLQKQTMNSKVNNWAVELEQYNLKLDWIPGSKNLLADSLSSLMDMVPDAKQKEEPDGQEFGNFCFENLKPAEVLEVAVTDVITMESYVEECIEHSINSKDKSQNQQKSLQTLQCRTEKMSVSNISIHSKQGIRVTEHENVKEIKLPLKTGQLEQLQRNDDYCREIARKMKHDAELTKIFVKEEGVLYRLWIEEGKMNKCILVPKVLQDSMLILAHDYSGHNGGRRTYNCLKQQYYWPGIRKQVFRHCKNCKECILQNQGQAEHGFSNFNTPNLPMQFICMDLVGPIQPASSRGNRYVLTVIDMLQVSQLQSPYKIRARTLCVEHTMIMCFASLDFGGSSRILTDNGSEFKNQEMKEICDTLGIKQIFSPVYTLQSNSRLEGWHRFFKACIAKHD